MKRLLFVTLLYCAITVCVAQNISFLGVPLEGYINTFSEKLATKGIKTNRAISDKLDEGARAYDVTFFKYPCLARVEYNPFTKNVFEGVLMFQITSSLTDFTQFMEYFAIQIRDKYNKGLFKLEYFEEEYNSYPSDHYIIYSTKNNKKVGEVFLYMDIKEYDKSSGKGNFLFQVMYRNSEAPSFQEQMQEYF